MAKSAKDFTRETDGRNLEFNAERGAELQVVGLDARGSLCVVDVDHVDIDREML